MHHCCKGCTIFCLLFIHRENSIISFVLGISWLDVFYYRFNLLRRISDVYTKNKANIIIIALDFLLYTNINITHSYCSNFDTPFKNKHFPSWLYVSITNEWYECNDTCKKRTFPESNEAFKPYQQTFISMQFITVWLCLLYSCNKTTVSLIHSFDLFLSTKVHTCHIKMMNRCFVLEFQMGMYVEKGDTTYVCLSLLLEENLKCLLTLMCLLLNE